MPSEAEKVNQSIKKLNLTMDRIAKGIEESNRIAARRLQEMREQMKEVQLMASEEPMHDYIPMDFQLEAKLVVARYYNDRVDKNQFKVTTDEVKIVWFSKTLQNWKALAITPAPDDMYYEVTHNGDKQETYIDAYKKVENVRITDTDLYNGS